MRWTRAGVASLTLILAMQAGSSAAAAVEWRAGVRIARSDAGGFVVDASYRERLSVVAWQEVGDATATLKVAISMDAGRGDFLKRSVADRVVGMAVAACGDSAFIAYRERRTDAAPRLRLARVPSDGGAIERITIRRAVPIRGTLDLACGSSRATVVWTERVGPAWRALVRHVRVADLGRTRAQDLGVAARSRVATAAAGDRAYVAWSDANGLRLKRYSIGAGPSFAVTDRPTQRLTTVGRAPLLAADGARVAIGYESASDPEVRVSRDRGASFPTSWGYGMDPGSATFVSLALEGRRIAGTVEFTYRDHEPIVHRVSSPDLGETWRQRNVAAGVVRPLDGFLTAQAGIKVAETYVRSDGAAAGWELVFRRER